MKTTTNSVLRYSFIARAVIAILFAWAASIGVSTAYASDLTAASITTAEQADSWPQTINRLYNRWSGEHLYTSDVSEAEKLAKIGWKREGVAWIAPLTGTPVYRLYNPYSDDHHYTTDASEYKKLGTIGWRQEGVAWYSADYGGSPIYRGFNRYVTIGTHHYTMDANEMKTMARNGWKDEGVGWYGYTSMADALTESIPIPADTYKAKYSYQVYLVDTGCAETYHDTNYALYVKTNNPDPRTIELINASTRERVMSTDTTFSDVESEAVGTYYYFARRVQGGYIMGLRSYKAGMQSFQLVEKRNTSGGFFNGAYEVYLNTSVGSKAVPRAFENRFYTVVGSFKLNILDQDVAAQAWMDSIIAKSTTADMDPLQKMDAVVAYINKNEGFTYYTLSENNNMTNFAKHPNRPYFVYKHCTSLTSPAILCAFAKRIGGFDDIHNCYYDYPRESSGWGATHYYMTCTYKGTKRYYTICPEESSGIIPSSDKVDFNDMSQFRRLS